MSIKQSITTNMVTENSNYEKIGCYDAYVKISNKLKGRSIPQSFLKGLESLRNAGNKYQVYKLNINAPNNADVLRQVIGRNGCYFIKTTQECDLDFIWHNRDNNTIEFWGPQESIQKAHSVIKTRINKYVGITVMEQNSPLDLTDENNLKQESVIQKMDYVKDSDGGMVHRSWATEEECKAHDSKTQNGKMVPEHNGEGEDVSKLAGSESGDQ